MYKRQLQAQRRRVGPGARRAGPPGGRGQGAQYGGEAGAGTQRGAVQPHGDQRRQVRAQCRVEGVRSLLTREFAQREAGEGVSGRGSLSLLPLLFARSGAAGARQAPRSEGQGGDGETEGCAVACEAVEVRGCRRLAGPAGPADHASTGSAQHEGRQAQLTGEVVQLPCRVRGGPQHRLQLSGRQFRQRDLVGHLGGVHHRGEGAVLGYGGQRRPQGRAVGGVAGEGGDVGPRRAQVRQQFGPGPGDFGPVVQEQEVSYAVFGDQVPGEYVGEGSPGAGDEHGAVRCARARVGVLGVLFDALQSRHVQSAGAQRGLRFA